MAVMTKVQPIDRDLILRLTAGAPATRSANFAEFAREQLKDAQEQNRSALGLIPPHKTFVDGREGASEDQVKPDDGVIVYEFELIGDLIQWIEDQLLTHSPIRSGQYRRSHRLYADDVEVQFGAEVPPARQFVFVNTAPYSRKIEGAGEKKPPQSSQAPDGVFQSVALLASSRFGNQARITFAYVPEPSGAVGEWAASQSAQRHAGRHGRERNAVQWLTNQPAIIVTLR